MSQIPTVTRYRPGVEQPSPFPKSGSEWTVEALNYIGIDHKVGCALDEIISPRIVPSPKITEYLESRLNRPWEDLLASEVSETKVDRETFYARLLQIAGPKIEGRSYDIPITSSQLSASTPPSEFEGFRTPEVDQSPMQPPRPSPEHFRSLDCVASIPISPTPAMKTGEPKEASARTVRDADYEWPSSPPHRVESHLDREEATDPAEEALPSPKRKTVKSPAATPHSSSDPSYQANSPSPRSAKSGSYHRKEEDPAEKDVEALARSLLLLIENAVGQVDPFFNTETWYVNAITPC